MIWEGTLPGIIDAELCDGHLFYVVGYFEDREGRFKMVGADSNAIRVHSHNFYPSTLTIVDVQPPATTLGNALASTYQLAWDAIDSNTLTLGQGWPEILQIKAIESGGPPTPNGGHSLKL